MADPSVVQWKSSTEVASGTLTASITLDAAPTAGNLLLAFCHNNTTPANFTVFPTGFTREFYQDTGTSTGAQYVFSRLVQAGDTAGPYSITVGATGTYPRITLVEITNQAKLVDWRVALNAASDYTSGLTLAPQTRSLTVRTPALVLGWYTVARPNSTTNITGPTEPNWTSVVPRDSGGSANSNHKLDAVLLGEATYPTGATVSHTLQNTTLNSHNYSNLAFIAIRSEPPAPPSGDVQIVQKAVTLRSATTTVSATLDATPTPGNLLLALVAWYGNNSDDITDVAGWTEHYETSVGNGNIHTMWLSHVVQAGDSATVSFTINPAGLAASSKPGLYLYEIKNQASGTAWNGGFGTAGIPSGQNVPATYTVVPYKPALILFSWTSIWGSGGDQTYIPVQPSEVGWTTLQYHPSEAYVTTSADYAGNAHIFKQELPSASYPHGGTRSLTTYVGSVSPQVGVSADFVIIYQADTGTTSAYVDYVAAEAVTSADPATIEGRTDHVATEVVSSADPSLIEARVDQVAIELVYSAPAEGNVDAVYAEVVTDYVTPPAEAQLAAEYVEIVTPHPLAAGNFGLNVDTVTLETVVAYPVMAGTVGAAVDLVVVEAVVPQGTVIAPPAPRANRLIPMIC